MSIRAALLQEYGSGQMSFEVRDVRGELSRRGIPCELFASKRLQRGQLLLAADVLVVADVPTMHLALKQLGVSEPEPNDYPECLRPFLYRRIWEDRLRSVVDQIDAGTWQSAFVKPKGRLKRFTGRVFRSRDDLHWLADTSLATRVWCSEVVKWRSEFRVFVIRGQMVGMENYSGRPEFRPDDRVIAQAIHAWEASGHAHAAYGIDFGLLDDGRTALVELNDGYSLGSFGFDRSLYTDVLITRWCELVGCQS